MEFDSRFIYGLQGANGCGKSMLLRVISGLIVPDSGTVTIDGKTLHGQLSFPPSIGVLIESPAFLGNMTGLQNLSLIASIQGRLGRAEIEDALRQVGLDPGDRRVYRKYSLGMKQRLGIACAIMGRPEIVLLDEPFNAIDAQGLEMLRPCVKGLREQGSLVILACHDKQELDALSDRIVEMKEGKICRISESSGSRPS